MTKANRISLAIMRSPLLWGALATLGFYGVIDKGLWPNEFVRHYFASNWVEYVETAMFFVGLSWLVLKAGDMRRQSAGIQQTLLGPLRAKPQPAEHADELLARLQAVPEAAKEGYLPRRLREALESVRRAESADRLDSELKYLSEVDAGRSHESYSLLRLVIWAIPILGFLGTVIGITQAIGSLSPTALEQSLPSVTGGLGIAFDTTALALSLSMLLMFFKFAVERMEGRLLTRVDSRAAEELAGRFEQHGSDLDPQVSAIRRMSAAVLQATEGLVRTQAEIWQTALQAARTEWSEQVSASGRQLEAALTGALATNMKVHAEHLAGAAESAAEQNRLHWSRLEKALVESASATRAQQAELVKQGEILLRVVEATGQVTRLQQSLNENLAALAGAQHFEETLLNLSGAIHLLNARLGQVASGAAHVELRESSVGRAA